MARGVGVDISEAALAVAGDNSSDLGLRDRARFLHSDWFGAVTGDLIVADPPTSPPRRWRDPRSARLEPHQR